MLVLTRKSQESVVVGGSTGFERFLKVTVLDIRGEKVRLGFEVDKDVPVHRLEVWERIRANGQPNGSPTAAKEEMDRWDDYGGGPPDAAPRDALCSDVP
jgi:carbon storage regulator